MFAFRADSSREIGSGHVMRCLSLADFLVARGNHCEFLCRPAPGDLIDEIERRGHTVLRMPSISGRPAIGEFDDARATAELLADLAVDWLVVDHYGLGIEWERAVGSCAQNLLVIDDIGRDHECSLLLDQNFPNPMHERYRRSLPAAKLLMGPQYALLRADFAASRPASLQRRTGVLIRVLVTRRVRLARGLARGCDHRRRQSASRVDRNHLLAPSGSDASCADFEHGQIDDGGRLRDWRGRQHDVGTLLPGVARAGQHPFKRSAFHCDRGSAGRSAIARGLGPRNHQCGLLARDYGAFAGSIAGDVGIGRKNMRWHGRESRGGTIAMSDTQ
jgi:hypothetical protein